MSKLTKVSMNLSNRSLANIDEISVIIDEKNKTRVVSASLQITLELLNRMKDNKLIIRDKNGDEQELHFIF